MAGYPRAAETAEDCAAKRSNENLVAQLLSNGISRRDFVRRLVATGVTTTAAHSILDSVTAIAQTPGAPPVSPESIKLFQGTGGEAFAEQLIASGVKYIFGNSASEDAHFYDALAGSSAAPVHPDAARGSGRRDGGRLREGLRPAVHRHVGRRRSG